jgi:hypothetical protein
MDNMTFDNLSRPLLERLSNSELIKLAEDMGIDIPPGLERIFIIEELLLESASLNQEKKEEIEINPSYSEPVALPKQYNFSFIDVIIRDPLWVYVFWEIKGQDREAFENAADFNGYCLRVIPLEEGEIFPKSMDNSFTVSVDTDDTARYLGLAEHSSQAAGRYVIKLSALKGEAEIQIAASLPFNLPRLIENGCICDLESVPLVRLSGVQDLLTIKNTDRESRVKRAN